MFIKDSNGCYLLEVPVSADQIIEKAKILLSRRFRRGTALSSPNDTRDYLQIQMAGLEREIFGVIYLDNRHKIIDRKNVFFGTIDGASVYPREIVKESLALNAAAVVFYHNHPSGIPEPSRADEILTKRLKDALALVDIRVLDHLVIGIDSVVSFAERGLI